MIRRMIDRKHSITLDPPGDVERERAEARKQTRMPNCGGLMQDELDAVSITYTFRTEPTNYEEGLGDKLLRC